MVLVGDIGGTNTTLALLDERNGVFTLRARHRYATVELRSVDEALTDFAVRYPELFARRRLCCLSAAGPVLNNRCSMTNVSFSIDGDAIAATMGVPSFIINDFSAICYALPLLSTHPHIGAAPFPHPDGSLPSPHGPVRAVIGAGTGLGTGFLVEDRGHYVAHPSEGGHTDFAPIDELTDALVAWQSARYPVRPGIEPYLSGQGITNAFRFLTATGRVEPDPTVDSIAALPDRDKPEAISRAAADHAGLAMVMELFVRLYARYASTTALFFLPLGGLYLAGGIAAKNESWFTDDHRFMRTFESNYNERITPLLREIPVLLIKDYDVSLYGAAHAAVSLA